jgi:pimeloyl-ACP methyl ester carboxylesterase
MMRHPELFPSVLCLACLISTTFGQAVFRASDGALDLKEIEHLAREVAYTKGTNIPVRSELTMGLSYTRSIETPLDQDASFRAMLQANDIEMNDYLDDKATDTQALLLKDKRTGKSYVLFRGTDSYWDWFQHGKDLTSPGYAQYKANRERLQKWVEEGNVTVIGHSLGGALGQHLAADFPDKVTEGYFFCSCGINTGTVAEAVLHGTLPPIQYFNHPNDIISECFGGEHVSGRIFYTTNNPDATYAAAHSTVHFDGSPNPVREYDFALWQATRISDWSNRMARIGEPTQADREARLRAAETAPSPWWKATGDWFSGDEEAYRSVLDWFSSDLQRRWNAQAKSGAAAWDAAMQERTLAGEADVERLRLNAEKQMANLRYALNRMVADSESALAAAQFERENSWSAWFQSLALNTLGAAAGGFGSGFGGRLGSGIMEKELSGSRDGSEEKEDGATVQSGSDAVAPTLKKGWKKHFAKKAAAKKKDPSPQNKSSPIAKTRQPIPITNPAATPTPTAVQGPTHVDKVLMTGGQTRDPYPGEATHRDSSTGYLLPGP